MMGDGLKDRRWFIGHGLGVAAGVVGSALGSPARADQHTGHAGTGGHGGPDGYVLGADLAQHCATCEYWGGQRRLAADGKTLTVMGLGWCNNPGSPNHQMLTSPEHGPMDVWRRWAALP